MEKKKKRKVLLGSLKVMVAVALLSVISFICGKFLSFPQEGTLRFSVENLPILLAGLAFGPVAGALTGVLADLVGCLIRGWAPIPLVTVGAAVIGFAGGLFYRFPKFKSDTLRTAIAVCSAHGLGSVVVKTLALAPIYGTPFWSLFGWRLLNYVIIGVLEFILLRILFRNKAFAHQIDRIKQ